MALAGLRVLAWAQARGSGGGTLAKAPHLGPPDFGAARGAGGREQW
jgi:hypothetical protein